MLEIERVDFVSVPTRDVERARRFYGDTGFFRDPDGNVLILHRRYAPAVRR